MKKHLLTALLAFALLLSTLSGCGAPKNPGDSNSEPTTPPQTGDEPQAPQTEEGRGGVFRDYTTGDIDIMNPYIYKNSASSDMLDKTGMTLYYAYATDDRSTFERLPVLAESEPKQMDDTHLVWQIKLRENAKWANGDPINVDDVIYSLQMALDPLLVNKQANQVADNYIKIANAVEYSLQGNSNTVSWDDVGIKRIDDYTLGLELALPATEYDVIAHFCNTWCNIVHRDTFEACMSADRTSNTYGSDLDSYMSCGQFIFTEWVPGSQFTLERNPDYVLADKIKLDGWVCKVLPDSNAALEMYLNGELDVVSLSSASIDTYIDDPTIKTTPSSTIQQLSVNIGNTDHNGILGNLNFRKALYFGVDRESLAKISYGTPANFYVQSKCIAQDGTPFRDVPGARDYLEPNNGYDPEKAKEYYDQAMSECGLTSLTLKLLYSESSTINRATSEYLSKSLPEVFGDSFALELQSAPSSVISNALSSCRDGDTNTYELTWSGWNTSTVAPWNGLKIFRSDYASRSTPYASEEYDALWDQANQSLEAKLDPDYRMKLTMELEQIALRDLPTIPVFEAPNFYLVNPRVHLFSETYIPAYGYGYDMSWVEE